MSAINLSAVFRDLVAPFTSNEAHVNECWDELHAAYTGKSRYYHSLTHLENLYGLLSEVKPQINDWNAVLFALFYHDAVYNTVKHNNEEKSAELARERLHVLNVPDEMIRRVEVHVLATKSHTVNEDTDTNYFTDADLAILGAPSEVYADYAAQVRKEYWVYPDIVYKPGRKKVLEHFLGMQQIFKTEYFREKSEKQARINLQHELEQLA